MKMTSTEKKDCKSCLKAITIATGEEKFPIDVDANDDNDDVQIVNVVRRRNDWKMFRNKNHDLAINASDVAACTGFHEFQSCPELMLKHIYQGHDGQKLLQHDAQLLGLQLISAKEQDEMELLEIAELSGSSTVIDAVKKTLKIKHGDINERNKIQTIEEANELKRKAAIISFDDDDVKTKNESDKIRKRLTKHQFQILRERTRQAVDTGCGHSWEDAALDQYEYECGWDVRERNAECRLWHFEKDENSNIDNGDGDGDGNDNGNGNGNGENNSEVNNGNNRTYNPTIRPIAPACARPSRSNRKNNDWFDSRGIKRKLRTYENYTKDVDSEISKGALLDHYNVLKEVEKESTDRPLWLQQQEKPQLFDPPPFLTIKGMVDGIRDELGPTALGKNNDGNETTDFDNNNNDDDDQSFSLSRVVVECKHRMRSLLPYPRFSECIQAVVYCFMYEADDADIIQVLRTKNSRTRNNSYRNTTQQRPLMTDYFQKSIPLAAESQGDNTVDSNTKNKCPSDVDILPHTTNTECNNTTNENKNLLKSCTRIHATGKVLSTKISIDRKSNDACDKGEKKEKNCDAVTKSNEYAMTQPTSTTRTTKSEISIKIAVNRIALDDHFGHRVNWKAVILPKLRRWADTVYKIRRSDDKRYQLLSNMAMAQSSIISGQRVYSGGNFVDDDSAMQRKKREYVRTAWELIFEECDFLREGISGERYRRETQM